MNNIILIRNEKIAHVRGFGSAGGMGRDTWDPLDLVTREGFFIPVSTHGAIAIPYLNHSFDLIELMQDEVISRRQDLDLGILIRADGYVCMVGVDKDATLNIVPVPRRGVHIFTSVDAYRETMVACVEMTDTIEDTIKLYRENINFNKNNAVIKPMAEYAAYWEANRPAPARKRPRL